MSHPWETRVERLEAENRRLREESENWRESFKNMSTVAREQSERIAALEAKVAQGRAPGCDALWKYDSHGKRVACQCNSCEDWRAEVKG